MYDCCCSWMYHVTRTSSTLRYCIAWHADPTCVLSVQIWRIQHGRWQNINAYHCPRSHRNTQSAPVIPCTLLSLHVSRKNARGRHWCVTSVRTTDATSNTRWEVELKEVGGSDGVFSKFTKCKVKWLYSEPLWSPMSPSKGDCSSWMLNQLQYFTIILYGTNLGIS